MNSLQQLDKHAVVRQSQIIIGGLCAGIVFFLLIVLVFLGARVQPFDHQAVISFVMAAMAVTLLPLRLIVPGVVVSTACQRMAQHQPAQTAVEQAAAEQDERQLLPIYLTKTIIGAAILEAGAFANLVAFLLEGQVYSLGLAILCLLGIVVVFPTQRGVSEWLEAQIRRINEFRAAGPRHRSL